MKQNISETTTNSHRNSLQTRINNPKKKYCTWNASGHHIKAFFKLKLSKPKIYEFWHKVHSRSKQYWNPRATEEPRAGLKHGCLNSQSELMESFGES